MITNKLYLSDMYAKEATAQVLDIKESKIILDQTIFYAESGGQVGDTGFINDIKVVDTQKQVTNKTRTVYYPNFPEINLNIMINHFTQGPLNGLQIGDKVELRIDWERRYNIMRIHSAIHVVLHYAWQVFGEDIRVEGCLMRLDKGRVDLAAKLDGKKVPEVEQLSNEFIEKNLEVENLPLENEPEALYWKCGEIKMPCGGTHVRNIGEIGPIKVKRRAQGKTLDRLYVQFK